MHPSAFGAILEQAQLPMLSLLIAMLTVCQVPKLLTSLGAGDTLKRALEGLSSCLGEHRLRLAPQDFLGHLGYRLFGSHGLSSPSVAFVLKKAPHTLGHRRVARPAPMLDALLGVGRSGDR